MTLALRSTLHDLILKGAYHPKAWKLARLYGGQMVAGGLALLYSWYVSRLLGATDFGRFAFLRALLAYLGLFAELGLAMSTSRLLALSNDSKEQSSLCGAWLVLFSPILLLCGVIVASGEWWLDAVFKMHVGENLLFLALPAIGIPMHMALRLLLRGANDTDLLVIHELLPWLLALLTAALLRYFHWISGFTLILSYTIAHFFTVIVLLTKLEVNLFTSFKFIYQLLTETRNFGLRAYWGLIVGTGSFQLDVPLLAYFTHDTHAIGFYSLAKMIVAPISILSTAVGITFFRRFAISHKLPKGLVAFNLLWLTIASSVLAIGAKPIVKAFLPEYSSLILVLYVWIIAAFIQGIYYLPNSLLNAAGYGQALQVMANSFAIVNLVLNFTLIPLLGVIGASLASAIAYLFWLMLCLYYYKKIEQSTSILES